MEEFLIKHDWLVGMIDEKGEDVIVSGNFIQIERKYFQGINLPHMTKDGKTESFELSYSRMKRYLSIPHKERLKLIKEHC